MTTNRCPICGGLKKNPEAKTCGDYSCMGVLSHRTRVAALKGESPAVRHGRKKKGKKYVQKILDTMLNDLDRMGARLLFLKKKNLR